eukprot:gene20552-27340_t
MAEIWSAEETAHCFEATEASFRATEASFRVSGIIMGGRCRRSRK